MPEVVEIRHYADFIHKKCSNKQISTIKILNGRYKKHKPFDGYKMIQNEYPFIIKSINTKGKFLYIIIQSVKTEKEYYILTTLGLTGGWTFYDKEKKKYIFPRLFTYIPTEIQKPYQERSLKHLNIEIKIKGNGNLYFFDTLSFGTFSIIDSKNDLDKKLNTIGPDIMNKETTFQIFEERIRMKKNKKKPIGNVLMNQKVISGIGNYLRADILWCSRISPFRKVEKLSSKELKKIYKMAQALTIGEYYYGKKKEKLHGIHLPHHYGRYFFVYQEENDIYGNKVVKEELYEGSQKRFIFWVPKIQK
jgi:formamidopyrimidine-DNA glycosylase